MNVYKTVKNCLLEYPTLFESRIDVFIQLFAVIGNGYEWVNGELVNKFDKNKNIIKMKYDDIDKNIAETEKDKTPCLKRLNAARLVNYKFEKLKRQFIEKNIKVIAAESRATLIDDYKIYACYYIENPCYDYAYIFRVPKDVKKDWGEAAQEFAKFWRQRLFSKHHGFCRPKGGKYVYIKSEEDCWNEQCKKDWKLAQKLTEVIDQIDKNFGRKTDSQIHSEVAADISKLLKEIEIAAVD